MAGNGGAISGFRMLMLIMGASFVPRQALLPRRGCFIMKAVDHYSAGSGFQIAGGEKSQ